MPKARITRTTIAKLEAIPGKQVRYFSDKLPGFGVLVNDKARTYFVQCRVKGKEKDNGKPLEIYESIGRVDVVGYDAALERAKEILEDASKGIDQKEKRDHKSNLEAAKKAEEEKRGITVADAFKELIAAKKKLKPRTIEVYSEDLDRYLGDWKNKPLLEITGDMVIARHAELGTRSKSRANGAMRILREIFNYASVMHEDIIFRNPVNKLSKVGGWYTIARRTNYIKPGQLNKWLSAIMALSNDTSRDYILFMLFQGSRKTETALLRWKDVDLSSGVVTLRETKTGVALTVPVSKHILEMLKTRAKYYKKDLESFVFPSVGKTGRIRDVRAALQVAGLKSGATVSPHDLRRSFLSYCEILKIPTFTRKRLVNHAISQDVTEGYTLFDLEELRRHIENIASFILSR